MARLHSLFQGGQVDTQVDTTAGGSFTISSPGFANMPVVSGSDTMAITVDPDGVRGAPEVLWVTAHVAAAVTVTATAAQETTTGRIHYVDEYWVHGPTPYDLTGSAMLGSASHRDVSDAATYTTTSTTGADVDATNLIATFTVPPSGKVRVRVSASVSVTSSQNGFFLVREGTSIVASQLVTQQAFYCEYVATFDIPGLVPGDVHTYKFGWQVNGGTFSMITGPTFGEALIEVYDFGVVQPLVAGPNVPDAAWHFVGAGGEPVFQNSWVNYDVGSYPASRVARFRKLSDGMVVVAGLVKTGATSTTAFTLPAGYRPLATNGITFPVIANGGVGQIQIMPDGEVIPANDVSSNVTTYCWLDGIIFYAEA